MTRVLCRTRISEAGDGDVTPRRRCGLVSSRAQPAEECGHDAGRDVSSSGRVVAVAPPSPPSPPDDAGLAQPGRTTHGEQLRLMAQLYAGCILGDAQRLRVDWLTVYWLTVAQLYAGCILGDAQRLHVDWLTVYWLTDGAAVRRLYPR